MTAEEYLKSDLGALIVELAKVRAHRDACVEGIKDLQAEIAKLKEGKDGGSHNENEKPD